MGISILKAVVLLLAVLAIALLVYLFAPGSKTRLEALFKLPAYTVVDFATLQKADKPNQYLVCPANYCTQKPDRIASTYPASAQAQAQAFAKIALSMPNVAEHKRFDDPSGFIQIDYVQRTPTMRYPDLITVRFIDTAPGQASLAIYSRSVYGRSDFNVNQKRIDAWLSILDKELKA
jgi:uncharacterized protein (DUF1499 family)